MTLENQPETLAKLIYAFQNNESFFQDSMNAIRIGETEGLFARVKFGNEVFTDTKNITE